MDDRTIVESNMPPIGGGEATRVMTVQGVPAAPAGVGYGERTQQAIAQTCPVCNTPNPPSERYCQDCGLLFGSISGAVEALPDSSSLPRLVGEGGEEYSLNPGPNVVGRERGDIILGNPTISRRHAQVIVEGSAVFVEDSGSTNGTFVAGQPARAGDRVPVNHGDTIKFGSILLSLNLPGNPATQPVAPVAAPVVDTPAVGGAAVAGTGRGPVLAHLVLGDGTEYPLYEGANVLGRRSGNDIVIADPFASGKHAEVICAADGTGQVIDAGSTNGTFIAGERLAANTPISLFDGMTVTFGKTPLTFRAQAASDWGPAIEATRVYDGEPMPDVTVIGAPELESAWVPELPDAPPVDGSDSRSA